MLEYKNPKTGGYQDVPYGKIMIKGKMMNMDTAKRQAKVQNFGEGVGRAVKKGLTTAAKSVKSAVKNSNLAKSLKRK